MLCPVIPSGSASVTSDLAPDTMGRRFGLFNDTSGTPFAPRLDARMVQPFSWLTPNRLVKACRVALAGLLLVVLIAGPDGLSTVELRFAIAYGVTIVAMPAFPRLGGRNIGGASALLFGTRWAFSTLGEGTAEMLMTQLAGVACALAPVYARNVGGLAGSSEGHISFTERRALWRKRSAGASRSPTHIPEPPPPAPAAPGVALLDYRPETGG